MSISNFGPCRLSKAAWWSLQCLHNNPRSKRPGFVEISMSHGVAPTELSRMLTFEIGFSDSHGGAISALAVCQRHLSGPGALIRARKGRGFVETSSSQGVAPAELSRMLTFEISFSDSHCAAILALAVSQRQLGGPDAPICAQKGSSFVEISSSQDVAPAELRSRQKLTRWDCRGHNLLFHA